MLSIFDYLSIPYAKSNPEKKYEYAVWKYFPRAEEKEAAHLGIVIFDGDYLEAKLQENFPAESIDLKAEFRRVREEIYIFALHLNSKKEKKLKEMIDAFSREEHFRFGQAKSHYTIANLENARDYLFRRYIG